MTDGEYQALKQTAHALTLRFPSGTPCRYRLVPLAPWHAGRIWSGFVVFTNGTINCWVDRGQEGREVLVPVGLVEVEGKPILEHLEAA